MADEISGFDDDVPSGRDASHVAWDIQRAGRAWATEEMWQRIELRSEKLEVIDGKILWDDEERVLLLGLLLEDLGADRAVRLGSAQVWRDAVASLGSRE